jgi:hypothetical protein
MIITSPIELEMGRIYNENNAPLPFVIWGDNVKHYAFLVERQASREEFIKCAEEMDFDKAKNVCCCQFYYKILTD